MARALKHYYSTPLYWPGVPGLTFRVYTSGTWHHLVNADKPLCDVANLEGENVRAPLHFQAGEDC